MSAAKKERFEFRLSTDDKETIEAAALLNRMSSSQFVAETAVARAEAIINEHKRISLTADAWEMMRNALDNPPSPNERMKRVVEDMNKDEFWKWD